MEGEEVTYDDLVSVASGEVVGGIDRTLLDDIIDWIVSQATRVIDVVADWISDAWSALQETVTSWISWAVEAIEGFVDDAIYWARKAYDWVKDVYYMVEDWISEAWDTIREAVLSVIDIVEDWVEDAADDVIDWITTKVEEVDTWISAAVSNITSTIEAWLSELWGDITGLVETWGDSISQWFTNLTASIGSFFADLDIKLEAGWEWLTTWMTENIVEPMNAWWDSFLARLFDFEVWVGTLFDRVEDWLRADVPGHSIRWLGWLGDIWKGIVDWFVQDPEYWEERLTPKSLFGLKQLLMPLGEMFNTVVTGFMEALEGFIATLGPTNPDIATNHYRSISSVGMTALAGLAGMTLAGSWLKPLGGAGMGQIAAMIYDMTNYKIITGAAITALTMAAIRTPLTYHFNELFRPWLLSPRDFMQLMSRQAFTDPASLQNPELVESVRVIAGGDGLAYENRMIGYQGYPAQYYGFFKELSYTPLRYFPLAGIARTGFFDKVWFTEALHRSGYSRTAIDALMVMYKKMVDENVQGTMSGAAVKRFKEGLTTEEQFSGELTMLGYSDDQIPKYMAAAKMDYAYDYIMDLLSAYRDAVRKGNLSIDGYRESLLDLGMVPERVEGYVYRERARLRPKEALTPIAPPTPEYETDAGKVMADTLRRRRRKLLISRDQEIAELILIGIEPDYAKAIASNDDIRLAEKGSEE